MAQFENLQQEFDRLPEREKFQLGMAGMFRMVEENSRRPRTRGYDSLLSGGYDNQKDDYETYLADKSVKNMTSYMSSQIYRVKITNALSDVVMPMSDMLYDIQFEDRAYRNRQHHESTLYYQGIINSISSLGEDNKSHFFSALYLNYQRFMRHPVWNSLLAFGNYVVKPLFKLGWGTLFGFGTKSNTDRIVDAIKGMEDTLTYGGTNSPGFMKRLVSQGLIGFAFNEMIGGIGTLYSHIFGKDKEKSFQEKTLDNQKRTVDRLDLVESILVDSNRSMNELRDVSRYSSSLLEQATKSLFLLPDKMQKKFTTGVYDGLLMFRESPLMLQAPQELMDSISKEEERHRETLGAIYEGVIISREASMNDRSYYEEALEKQQRNIDELSSHNRRERRRTLLGALGRFGLGASILGGGLGLILSQSVRDGFKWAIRTLWNSAREGFNTSTLTAAVATAGMLLLRRSPIGLKISALVTGMSLVRRGMEYLVDRFDLPEQITWSSWDIARNTAESLAGWWRAQSSDEIAVLEQGQSEMVARLNELAASPPSLQGLSASERREANNAHREELEALTESIRVRRQEIASARERIASNRQLISADAIHSALLVANSRSRSDDSWFEEFRQRLIQQESGGRQDAVSWMGATGTMQLMPGTARDVARRMGVEFDLNRLRNDREYNEMLGTRYLQERLEMFDGDPVLAAFAYNAGAGATRRLISRYGDPRTGEISHAEWLNRIEANHSGDRNSWGTQSVPYARNVGMPMLGQSGSSSSGLMGNMRSSAPARGLSSFISAITGGTVNAGHGDGFLNGIISSMTGETQEDSGPDRVIATIDNQSIQALARQIERLTEGLVNTPTVNFSGVGD